jgi:hypothetical protein
MVRTFAADVAVADCAPVTSSETDTVMDASSVKMASPNVHVTVLPD